MDPRITSIDGSIEQQTEALKQFFGLQPEQSFEDITINEEEN